MTALLSTSAGAGVAGRDVRVEAAGGVVGPVTDRGDGTYTARVEPGAPSGELPITARLTAPDATLEAQRTALVMPFVGDGWGQPEPVRGMVNTAGYEDGGSISPDGQWLVLTDYSPVDVLCCINGCAGSAAGDPMGATCQTSQGPVDGESRPDFPGRDRILSPTRILNRCPSVCFTSDFTATGGERTDTTLFPVGGYVFHRQPDGSFAEPRFLGFGADGCVTPTGYSFVSVNGATAQLVYSWTLPWGPDGSSLYWSSITLGQPNVMGSFTCTSAGQVQVTGGNFSRLNVDITPAYTNPVYRGGLLMWEDDKSTPHRTFFARGTGALPGTTFTPTQNHPRLAVGDAAHDQIMPFLDDVEDRLYFTDNGEAAVAAWNGADPAVPGSWGAPKRLLVPETGSTRAGRVLALGQPTVAHLPDGSTEMYFIYAVWTGTGINAQAGVVKRN